MKIGLEPQGAQDPTVRQRTFLNVHKFYIFHRRPAYLLHSAAISNTTAFSVAYFCL